MKISEKVSKMFCSKDKFEQKYKVKDLYVGLLGIVCCKDIGWDEEFSFKSVGRYVIYRKKKFFTATGSFYGDYVGQDLFTNREYFFFYQNTIDTLYKAVNSLAICKTYPLELFLPNLGDTITKSELLELYNTFNKFEKKEGNNAIDESDRFCETLSRINSLLETSSVDGDLRRTMSEELEKLKQYYIDAEMDALIYKSNNNVKSKRRTK